MEKRSIGFGFFGKTRGRKTRSALEQAEMQAKVAIKGNKTHVWGETDARTSIDDARRRTQSMPISSGTPQTQSLQAVIDIPKEPRQPQLPTSAPADDIAIARTLEAESSQPLVPEIAPVLPALPPVVSPISDTIGPLLEAPAETAPLPTEMTAPLASVPTLAIRKQFSFCPSTMSVRDLGAPALVSLREQAEAYHTSSTRSLSTSSSSVRSPYPRHSAAAASKSNPSLLYRTQSRGSDGKFNSTGHSTRRSSASYSVASDHHVSIYGDDESDSDLDRARSPHGSLRYSHSLISRASYERTALGSQVGSNLSLDVSPCDALPAQICMTPVPDALRGAPFVVPAGQSFRPGTFDADEYECDDADDFSSVSGMSVLSSLSDSDEPPSISSPRQGLHLPVPEPDLSCNLHPGLRRASIKRSVRVSYLESGDGGYIVERRHRRKASQSVKDPAHTTSNGSEGLPEKRLFDTLPASPASAKSAQTDNLQNIPADLLQSQGYTRSAVIPAVQEENEWVVEREYVPCGI